MERIWLIKMILNKRLLKVKVVRLKEKYSKNTYSYPRGEITREKADSDNTTISNVRNCTTTCLVQGCLARSLF